MLLIALGSVILFSYVNEVRALKYDTFHNITRAKDILTHVKDSESNVHGYIITGKNSYLKQYHHAIDNLFSNELTDYIKHQGRTPQEPKFQQLDKLLKKKKKELQHLIHLKKTHEGIHAIQQHMKAEKSLESSKKIDSLVNEILKDKTENFEYYNELQNSIIGTVIAFVIGGNVLAFLLLCSSLIILNKKVHKILHIEDSLSNLNELHTAIVNSTNQAIITIDFKGNIASYNPGATYLFGFAQQEVLQKPLSLLYDEVANKEALENLSKEYNRPFRTPMDFILFLTEEGFTSQQSIWKAKKKDGTVFDFLRTFTPLKESSGKIKGALIVGTDISEQKKREEELIIAQKKALAASDAKSRFLASISHDLRTPLNSIIGFSSLLIKNKAGNLNDEQLSYLKRVSGNGTILLNLINSILDLARIESGKIDLDFTPINLEELLFSTIHQLEGHMIDKAIKMQVDIPHPLEPVYTDGQKLTQVLYNLIGNAIKFTDDGYVKIQVLKDDKSNRATQINIIDTGKGIDPKHLSKIFEAFYQTKDSQQPTSSGLGLAISLALCKAMGYDLRVTSELGKGSAFSIILNPF